MCFSCQCTADCRTGVFNQVWPKHSWFIPLHLNSRAPGLWVSADLFRQKGWRMMGSSYKIRVFVLSPRGGTAGVFLMVPVVLLLPQAPSGRCPELLLYGGLVCSFYLKAERLQHCSWICAAYPFCPGSFPPPAEHQRGFHAQLLLKELSSSLGRFVISRECFFLKFSCCLLLKHSNPLIPPQKDWKPCVLCFSTVSIFSR